MHLGHWGSCTSRRCNFNEKESSCFRKFPCNLMKKCFEMSPPPPQFRTLLTAARNLHCTSINHYLSINQFIATLSTSQQLKNVLSYQCPCNSKCSTDISKISSPNLLQIYHYFFREIRKSLPKIHLENIVTNIIHRT